MFAAMDYLCFFFSDVGVGWWSYGGDVGEERGRVDAAGRSRFFFSGGRSSFLR
jgi:hypothetical protein